MSKPDLVRPTKSGGTCAGVVANGLWVCFVLCLVIRHCSGSDDTRVNAERDRVAPPGWRLLWRDDFDGAQGSPPSALRWTARDNMTHGDLEQQLYVASACELDGVGHLVLTTSRAKVRGPGRQYNFTSGWVDTQGKMNATFGRWEVRAKLPDPTATGIWPAHWLMPEPSAWDCWPVGGEIDIMESNGGIFNNTVMGTYHWGANCSGTPPPPPGPNCTCGCGCDLHHLVEKEAVSNGVFECVHPPNNPWQCTVAHDFSKDFHVFSVEWTTTSITWFVDDKEYWRRTLGVDHVNYIPQEPMYIILNTAIQPQVWNRGSGVEGDYPVQHIIDWVQVWEKAPVR